MKTCSGLDGIPVERILKFSSTHHLLSYSIATNIPGCPGEIFACRDGDTESDIKTLVDKFVSQLLAISEKSFARLQTEYNDVLLQLNKALAVESAYNDSLAVKTPSSEIKDLQNIFITWLRRLPCLGFNSS